MSDNVVDLQNWRVCADPYAAPEQGRVWLVGVVQGHPRLPDGETIETSPIASADGRLVTTRSGTVYRLGAIDPKYRRWMKGQGIVYDPTYPVKVGERCARAQESER